MSSILEEVKKIENLDTVETETELEAELDAPTSVIPLSTKNKVKKDKIKRPKGRPNIHPMAGRTYLLKEEVVAALENPDEFASTMQDTHVLSYDRKVALAKAGFLNNQDNLELTLNGPIVETINRAKIIGENLSSNKYNVEYKISKERIVPTSNALAIKPTIEQIELNGKNINRITMDEFSPDRIYVYITASI